MNSSTLRSSSPSLTPARTCERNRTRARATRSPARLKPSISFLLRSTTMGASYRSTSRRRWSCYASHTLRRGFDEAGGDAPWPICEARFLGLARLGEHCASWDEGPLAERERVDDPGVGAETGCSIF